MFEKLPSNARNIKTSRIYNVPIDKIVQIKALLREYDMVSVVKLASSIRRIGLIEPIILRLPYQPLPQDPEDEFMERKESEALPCPNEEKSPLTQRISHKIQEIKKLSEHSKDAAVEDKYLLISGGYRLRAFKMLGLTEIPARFMLYSENNEASIQMVGEIFGTCSDIFERSRKFVRTCIDRDMNACELASDLGLQSKYAESLFNIAKMSDSEADLASLYKLSFETVAQIAKVKSPIARLALIEEAKDGKTSHSDLAKQIDDINSGRSKSYTQNRKFFCKDTRIYVNTIQKTVKAMAENGLNAEFAVNEDENQMSITINVSRETSSIAVEKDQTTSLAPCKTVENSVETMENTGVSHIINEFSAVDKQKQAFGNEIVENYVENVENTVCPANNSTKSQQNLKESDNERPESTTASDRELA